MRRRAGTPPGDASILSLQVVYFDEAAPGNAPRPDTTRKPTAVYVAARELGSLPKHECLRMPVAVLRASTIKTTRGKWPHCLKVPLRSMPPDEDNVRDGLLVPDIGVAFTKLANILGDADALRQCWSATGAAGIFPATETPNVRNTGPQSPVPHDTTGTFVTIAEVDTAQCSGCVMLSVVPPLISHMRHTLGVRGLPGC